MRKERRNKEKTGRQLTCLLIVTEERKADLLKPPAEWRNGQEEWLLKPFRTRTCGLSPELQQFLRRVQLPVLAGVMQRHVRVRALLALVNLAGIKRLRVHMDADRPLIELRQIQHLVHRLQRI